MQGAYKETILRCFYCEDEKNWMNKAKEFEKSGSWVEAAEAYEKAGDKEKAAKCLWEEYGNAIKEQKMHRTVQILDEIEKKYSKTKSGRGALFHKAYRYRDLGDKDKALATFKEYVLKYPEGERIEDAYIEIAGGYLNRNDVQQTIVNYKKAIQISKKKGFYPLIVASQMWNIYAHNKDYHKAINAIEDTIKEIETGNLVIGGYDCRSVEDDVDKKEIVDALKDKIEKYKEKAAKFEENKKDK